MKYKGTQIIPVRIPEDLRLALEEYRLSRNERSAEMPWTRTDLIVKALREFLDHRVKRSRRKEPPQPQGEQP